MNDKEKLALIKKLVDIALRVPSYWSAEQISSFRQEILKDIKALLEKEEEYQEV